MAPGWTTGEKNGIDATNRDPKIVSSTIMGLLGWGNTVEGALWKMSNRLVSYYGNVLIITRSTQLSLKRRERRLSMAFQGRQAPRQTAGTRTQPNPGSSSWVACTRQQHVCSSVWLVFTAYPCLIKTLQVIINRTVVSVEPILCNTITHCEGRSTAVTSFTIQHGLPRFRTCSHICTCFTRAPFSF